MKYEKMIAGVMDMVYSLADYIENDCSVPFPLSWVVVVIVLFVVLMTMHKV